MNETHIWSSGSRTQASTSYVLKSASFKLNKSYFLFEMWEEHLIHFTERFRETVNMIYIEVAWNS